MMIVAAAVLATAARQRAASPGPAQADPGLDRIGPRYGSDGVTSDRGPRLQTWAQGRLDVGQVLERFAAADVERAGLKAGPYTVHCRLPTARYFVVTASAGRLHER